MKVLPLILISFLFVGCAELLVAEKNYRREVWVMAMKERQAAAAVTRIPSHSDAEGNGEE